MKVLQIIKKVLVTIICIIFFAFAILMTVLLLGHNDYGVTQFGDTTLVVIKQDVSSDNYKKGDLVIVESKKLDKINVGDEIFAYKIDDEGNANIDFGKVGKKYENDDAIAFENGSTYGMKFVIGSSSKVYNKFGTYLSIIESRWGFLFIILVPSFLIFIYELYALIVEIKYGDEEEQY